MYKVRFIFIISVCICLDCVASHSWTQLSLQATEPMYQRAINVGVNYLHKYKDNNIINITQIALYGYNESYNMRFKAVIALITNEHKILLYEVHMYVGKSTMGGLDVTQTKTIVNETQIKIANSLYMKVQQLITKHLNERTDLQLKYINNISLYNNEIIVCNITTTNHKRVLTVLTLSPLNQLNLVTIINN